MISVDFGAGLEWWTRGILFERIIEGIPIATERDQEIKLRLEQAMSVGGLDMEFVTDDMRADIIEALLQGVDTVICAMEPQAGTEEGDRYLTHLRELRATALSARS